MALIKKVKGIEPKLGKNVWLAETATILGEVTMGDNCNIWFNAVLRADVHFIKLGNNVNVQDNVSIHATYEKYPTTIGDNVSIGHNAVVHGCTIEDNVLIGMGAIIMDGAYIKTGSIIGAGAVVTEGKVVESGSIFAGNPAKKIKDISVDQVNEIIFRIAKDYPMYASWYDKK